MNAQWLVEYPALTKVGLALLHFLWQGAALAAVAALALVALRKASAASRYAALLVVLAVMAITPAATYLALSSSRTADARPVWTMVRSPQAAPTGAAQTAAPGPAAKIPAVPPAPSVLALRRNLLPWVAVVWALGVLLFSLRLLVRWRGISLACRRSADLVGEQWTRVMGTLARRLHVARSVRLAESAAIQVPSLVGWLRPVILLPATALTGLSPEQWQALLAHELAHIRRGDYLVNLAQSVVETLLFYHPAVWWVSSLIRLEREHCCDELAVAACGDAVTYLQALSRMEQLRTVPEPALGAGGSLVRRVRRLTETRGGDGGHLPQRLAGVVRADSAHGLGAWASPWPAAHLDGRPPSPLTFPPSWPR